MKVLVDGVAFAGARSGVVGEWTRLLVALARDAELSIAMLDRGCGTVLDGVTPIAFPSYRAEYTAADSQLLQRVATHHEADVFVSTGWTTPTTTPSIAVIFAGSLPPAATLTDRESAECALAVRHATRVVYTDQQARTALRDHLGFTPQRLIAAVDAPGDTIVGVVTTALRLAAATAVEADDFYTRWAAIRDLQARVDG